MVSIKILGIVLAMLITFAGCDRTRQREDPTGNVKIIAICEQAISVNNTCNKSTNNNALPEE